MSGLLAKYRYYSATLDMFTKGENYAMTTPVSKENNLGPDDKIRYIWGLKDPSFIL